MRFASLGSGSKGNGWLVEQGETCLLVDCGFGPRALAQRLAVLGKAPQQITAIVLTHEHSDHVGGVMRCVERYRLRVLATAGTRLQLASTSIEVFDSHCAFEVGDLQVQPFAVPHDAREPVQFVVSDGDRRLGLLTDCGHVTPHLRALLDGCSALVVECNHDSDLLTQGPYPDWLKARVAGPYGHLANAEAAALLACLDTRRLRHVVAAHLSEKNNRPHLAATALAGALGCAPQWIAVAGQVAGLGWRSLA